MSTTEGRGERIIKREFLTRVAVRSGVSREVVEVVYEALEAELISAARRDQPVVLTGFGRFYRQFHKGHTVQFGKGRVDDYSVLKFSSLRGVNRRLDEPLTEEEQAVVRSIDEDCLRPLQRAPEVTDVGRGAEYELVAS